MYQLVRVFTKSTIHIAAAVRVSTPNLRYASLKEFLYRPPAHSEDHPYIGARLSVREPRRALRIPGGRGRGSRPYAYSILPSFLSDVSASLPGGKSSGLKGVQGLG